MEEPQACKQSKLAVKSHELLNDVSTSEVWEWTSLILEGAR